MTIYLFLIILLSILSRYGKINYNLIIAFFLLFIVGGLRDSSVGSDSQNYAMLFDNYESDATSTHANEPLFLVLFGLTAVIGLGANGLQMISMLIILVGVFYVVKKWSINPVYSILSYVLLYFYFYSFNTMRQYLAVPFVLLFIYFLHQKETRKSFVCLVIAVLFHYSAIIAILVLIFKRIKFPKGIKVALILCTFFMGITPIVQYVMQNVSSLSSSLAYYSDNDFYYNESLFSLSRLMLNFYAILLILLLNEKNSMLSILTVGICILNLFAFNPVLGRFAQFFTIIQIIIIPNIPEMCRDKRMVGPLSYGSLVYMIVTWVYLITANVGEVVPWKLSDFGFI